MLTIVIPIIAPIESTNTIDDVIVVAMVFLHNFMWIKAGYIHDIRSIGIPPTNDITGLKVGNVTEIVHNNNVPIVRESIRPGPNSKETSQYLS